MGISTRFPEVKLVYRPFNFPQTNQFCPSRNIAEEYAYDSKTSLQKNLSYFYGLPFIQFKDAMVPRNDSEQFIDLIAIQKLQKAKTLIDMCCGTGCLGITAKNAFPNIETVFFIDISSKCIFNTYVNIVMHKLEKYFLICEDILKMEKVPEADILLCNPPYIKTQHINNNLENHLCLDGGRDGFKFIRKIIKIIKKSKVRTAIIEIGYCEHASKIKRELRSQYKFKKFKDINQKDRFCLILSKT